MEGNEEMTSQADQGPAHRTAEAARVEAARAADTLGWAKDEVLDLVDSMVNALDDDDFASIQGHLAILNSLTTDPARRLAILLQMSVACAGIVDIAQVRQGIDRTTLALDLAPALRTCLHQAQPAAKARCR